MPAYFKNHLRFLPGSSIHGQLWATVVSPKTSSICSKYVAEARDGIKEEEEEEEEEIEIVKADVAQGDRTDWAKRRFRHCEDIRL